MEEYIRLEIKACGDLHFGTDFLLLAFNTIKIYDPCSLNALL